MPESARWLIGAGRLQEARAVIERAALENGTGVPEHLLKAAEGGAGNQAAETRGVGPQATVLDLFRPSKERSINIHFLSITTQKYGCC